MIDIPLVGQELKGKGRPSQGRRRASSSQRFIVGPENRLLELAVRSLLAAEDNHHSPLVFCGGPGSGKSHLAVGLAAAWKVSFPKRPVVSVTAVDFARELAEIIETKTVEDFGTRYRMTSLLVLEDIDYLDEKPFAQQALVSILDRLSDAGSWTVVTARSVPAQLVGIAAGLRSRLSAGLVVPLFPPGAAARLAIIKHLAAVRDIPLSESAAEVLASALPTTVPELSAVLSRLQVSPEHYGRVIDADDARRLLQERSRAPAPSLDEIARKTAQSFRVRLSELRGPGRSRTIVTARGVAIYLARTLTANSLEKIGNYFNGRDHTTVSYSFHKIEKLITTDMALRQAVHHLQTELQGC